MITKLASKCHCTSFEYNRQCFEQPQEYSRCNDRETPQSTYRKTIWTGSTYHVDIARRRVYETPKVDFYVAKEPDDKLEHKPEPNIWV